MKTYFVSIQATVWGTIEVEAENEEEAEETAYNNLIQNDLKDVFIEEAEWLANQTKIHEK